MTDRIASRVYSLTLASLALALLLTTAPAPARAAETIKVGFMAPQFWTYKADEFLKLPAYGRDYPPARP